MAEFTPHIKPAGWSADAPVVTLKGVRKAYNVGLPSEVEVLHGLDLTLPRGEFCAVMGPSGSGKSTLLNLVGLLDRPTAGTLEICAEQTVGLDDRGLTRLRGERIGFVFQYHHLLSAFTTLENVLLPLVGARGRISADMVARGEDLLERVGLSPWRDQPAQQLSGGQQQRVAVARALVRNPPLLLADEPTGNLDTKSAQAVFELLREVSRTQGTAVLFVTHNPELAAACDRTVRVVDGVLS